VRQGVLDHLLGSGGPIGSCIVWKRDGGFHNAPVPVPAPAPAPEPAPVGSSAAPGAGSSCDLGNITQNNPHIRTMPRMIDSSIKRSSQWWRRNVPRGTEWPDSDACPAVFVVELNIQVVCHHGCSPGRNSLGQPRDRWKSRRCQIESTFLPRHQRHIKSDFCDKIGQHRTQCSAARRRAYTLIRFAGAADRDTLHGPGP
jgi:hypothetical protein